MPLPSDAVNTGVRNGRDGRLMAHVVVFEDTAKIAVWSRELPPPGPGQVLVRMLATLISPGSERRVLQRSFDAPHWNAWAKFPFFPGYCAVGVVEDCGPDATLRIGQRVVVGAPHTSRAIVSARACLPVDGDLPVDAHAWCALAKIAAMALAVMPPPLGRHVAVVGDGPLAQMSVRWLHCAGAQRITVIGKHERRLQHALEGGASDVHLYDGRVPEPGDHDAAAPEAVIDASGTDSGFTMAQALAARGGTVVMLGDPGYPGALRVHPRFVPDGLHLVGVRDGLETGAWNTAGIIRTFLRLVKSGAFRVNGLITHRVLGEQAMLAYEICADKSSSMGVVLDWEGVSRPETR